MDLLVSDINYWFDNHNKSIILNKKTINKNTNINNLITDINRIIFTNKYNGYIYSYDYSITLCFDNNIKLTRTYIYIKFFDPFKTKFIRIDIFINFKENDYQIDLSCDNISIYLKNLKIFKIDELFDYLNVKIKALYTNFYNLLSKIPKFNMIQKKLDMINGNINVDNENNNMFDHLKENNLICIEI